MADLQKMDRTWLCSVLFMDIVNYSSQSVDVQMKWKARFNGYLAEAIRDVPESERVILDTGDGAAVCFLGAPEAAMFAALHLWHCFVSDAQEQQPGLRVRTGVNLGPVKLVKDLNGSLNAIGDGINAGQRIMSFAPENQILVSQSYFEVVSRLSDDYKVLFKLKGVETDKHVREHTVYTLLPPGSGKSYAQAAAAGAPGASQTMPMSRAADAAPAPQVAGAPAKPLQRRSRVPILIGAGLVILIAALAAWRFAGIGVTNVSPPANVPAAKAGSVQDVPPSPSSEPAEVGVTNTAKLAYDEGMRLIEEEMPAEAMPHFDTAIRANPKYVLAYLGRAQSRRLLKQYEMSIEDCNRAMQIKPEEPRVYFCRGLSEGLLKRYDQAVRDYGEAIRLNAKFAPAYEMRGEANFNLQQYGRALDDLNRAILLKPNNAPSYIRRALVHENLRQYEKAILDYDQAIRLQPANARAYNGRANAKRLSGDQRGAAADQRYARHLKER
jgi:Flp pilus assembly protein TadD/class 3 adenylate cyclase